MAVRRRPHRLAMFHVLHELRLVDAVVEVGGEEVTSLMPKSRLASSSEPNMLEAVRWSNWRSMSNMLTITSMPGDQTTPATVYSTCRALGVVSVILSPCFLPEQAEIFVGDDDVPAHFRLVAGMALSRFCSAAGAVLPSSSRNSSSIMCSALSGSMPKNIGARREAGGDDLGIDRIVATTATAIAIGSIARLMPGTSARAFLAARRSRRS